MAASLPPRFNRSNCFWRSVIGVVAAYALALQGILIGFAGAPLAVASYDHTASGFELCLNNGPGDSGSPTEPGLPHHPDHCIFCFSGVHQGTGAPAHSYAGYGGLGHGNALAVATTPRPSDVLEYSIARPRGPPISA